LDHLMAADRLHSARRVAQRDVVHRAASQRSRWADMQPPFGPGGQMVQTYRPLL